MNVPAITDHAVLRYIERVFEIDIESMRRQLLDTPGLRGAILAGAKHFATGGVVFSIRDSVVVTVQIGESGAAARIGAARNKHGRTGKAPAPRYTARENQKAHNRRPRHVPDLDAAE